MNFIQKDLVFSTVKFKSEVNKYILKVKVADGINFLLKVDFMFKTHFLVVRTTMTV